MSSEWKTLTLSEIALNGKEGLVDGPFGSALPADSYKPSGVPVIRGSNLSRGEVRFKGDEFVFVSEELAQKLSRATCIADDIVFTKKGTLGQVGIVPHAPHSKYLLSSNQMRLRVNRDLIRPDFAYYYLSQKSSIDKILRDSEHTGVPKINLAYLRAFPITVPPLAAQDVILSVLKNLDLRIALLRETSATLEAIAQALFKSWFVDFDPVHANAGTQAPSLPPEIQALFPATFTDSPQGLIPEGWEWSTIAESFILTMGQSPPGDTYNETGEGLPFYQGRTDYGFRFPTQRVFCTAPTRLAQRGDSLVSVRAPVGDVNIALENCALGRGVAGVRHPRDCNSFVFYALKLLKPHFEHFNGEGTVFGSINKKDFQNLPVIDPKKPVLDAFEAVTSSIDAQIENNEIQLRTLISLRDTLLPRLISGQLRLPEAEQAVAAITD